jgi:hypothetical protein
MIILYMAWTTPPHSAVTSKDGHGASDVSWPCMSAKKHTGMCHVQCKLGLTAVISDLLRVIVCTVAVLVYDVHGLCQLAVHLAIAIVVLTRAGFSINVDLDEQHEVMPIFDDIIHE